MAFFKRKTEFPGREVTDLESCFCSARVCVGHFWVLLGLNLISTSQSPVGPSCHLPFLSFCANFNSSRGINKTSGRIFPVEVQHMLLCH